MNRRLLALALFFGLASCDSDSSSPVESDPTELAVGTWGGLNVGLIADDTRAHVHVGCTLGNFPMPVHLDAEQRFNVAGEYMLRAYPVAVGPMLPAQFAGVVRGETLTFTVAVNDTVEKRLVVLGPVTVIYKRDPQMGPCPICDVSTMNKNLPVKPEKQ